MAMTTFAPPRILRTTNVVPQTQNTAPVVEFRCLFSFDIRRKQKRWQDGYLKYHTFNKRVMVYDERNNFVGDTHWREDYSFEEGEDIELERNGILVQVSECVGTREQDLSELLDKRRKAWEEKVTARENTSRPLRTPLGQQSKLQTPLASRQSLAPPPCLLSQAPLSHIQLQTPRLHIQPDGPRLRLAITSNQPTAKRRKVHESPPSKSAYAQNLTGAILSLSGPPMGSAPLRQDPPFAPSSRQQQQIESVDMISDHPTNYKYVSNEKLNIMRPERSPPLLFIPDSTAKEMQKRRRLQRVPHEKSGNSSSITRAVPALIIPNPIRDRISPVVDKPNVLRRLAISVPSIEIVNMSPMNSVQAVGDLSEESTLIDIDVFHTNSHHQGKKSPNQSLSGKVAAPGIPVETNVIKLSTDSAPQLLVESQILVTEETQAEADKQDQPYNQLRLKSHPKKKLLYRCDPQQSLPATKRSSRNHANNMNSDSRLHHSGYAYPLIINGCDTSNRSRYGRTSAHLRRNNSSTFGKTSNLHQRSAKFLQDSSVPPHEADAVYQSQTEATFQLEKLPKAHEPHKLLPSLEMETKGDLQMRVTRSPSEIGTYLGIQSSSQIQESCFYSKAKSNEQFIEDNALSSIAKTGIDHFTIDALLSHPSLVRPMKTVKIARRRHEKTECSISEIGVSLPLSNVTQNPSKLHEPTMPNSDRDTTDNTLLGKPLEQMGLVSDSCNKPQIPLSKNQITEESARSIRNISHQITHRGERLLYKKSPPRVIKTLNKSARSKEVVGFIVPVELELGHTKASQQAANKILENPVQMPLRQPAKLANPATRSRKAASRADAAGKLAQTIVPPNVQMAPQPHHATRKQNGPSDAVVSSKPYTPCAKDGAEMGPWSREAFDLFDFMPASILATADRP